MRLRGVIALTCGAAKGFGRNGMVCFNLALEAPFLYPAGSVGCHAVGGLDEVRRVGRVFRLHPENYGKISCCMDAVIQEKNNRTQQKKY